MDYRNYVRDRNLNDKCAREQLDVLSVEFIRYYTIEIFLRI